MVVCRSLLCTWGTFGERCSDSAAGFQPSTGEQPCQLAQPAPASQQLSGNGYSPKTALRRLKLFPTQARTLSVTSEGLQQPPKKQSLNHRNQHQKLGFPSKKTEQLLSHSSVDDIDQFSVRVSAAVWAFSRWKALELRLPHQPRPAKSNRCAFFLDPSALHTAPRWCSAIYVSSWPPAKSASRNSTSSNHLTS